MLYSREYANYANTYGNDESNAMTYENEKLHLKSTKDWILWFDQLQSKAKSYGLWQAIDPSVSAIRTGNTIASLIEAPERPLPSDHPRRAATRGASSAASQSVTPGRDDYSVLLSASDTHTPRAEGIQDLSPENLALYKERRMDYGESLRAYEARMKRYRELQDWFRSTVDVELLRHCCTADKNLDEWVKSLQKRVGTRPHERRNEAQAAYEAVLEAPTRKHLNTQKDVENWLAKWEAALHEADASGLPQAKHSSLWFTGFTKALSNSYLTSWVFTYIETKIDQAEDDELTAAQVLADARRCLRITSEPNPRAKTARGAFGPTIPADEAEEEVARQPSRAPRGRGRGRGRGGRGGGRATQEPQL